MGKRLKRYFYNELSTAWPSLFGSTATIIFKGGTSLFCTIVKKDNQIVIVEDKIPRIHRIEIENIYEIVVDSKEDY